MRALSLLRGVSRGPWKYKLDIYYVSHLRVMSKCRQALARHSQLKSMCSCNNCVRRIMLMENDVKKKLEEHEKMGSGGKW